MEFSPFDVRKYKPLPAQEGYAEWARLYEQTVEDEMDIKLLERIKTVKWSSNKKVVDLACGTGRTGKWLRSKGIYHIDGVDLTPEMLAKAEERGVHNNLINRDIRDTGLPAESYDLAIEVLADEHLSDLHPFYAEAARITKSGGRLVIVGYHSHFLMRGVITHFHKEDGEAVAVESYVHLFSDHVKAAHAAGFRLLEADEGIVDAQWLAKKPQWKKYEHHPVSFCLVWEKAAE